jgi:hypothetical protein
MGWTDVADIAKGSFLAAALSSLSFIYGNFTNPSHQVRIAADRLCDDVTQALRELRDGDSQNYSGTSPTHPSAYALQISQAIEAFSHLFHKVNGRPPTIETDGFTTNLHDLIKIAPKFQHRYATLKSEADLTDLRPRLTDEQRAMLRSQTPAATAPALLGLPTNDNTTTNSAFQWTAARRLLQTNIGRYQFGDKCPAYPKKCNLFGKDLDDVHCET